MCTTCGCGDTELVPVELHEKILAGNDRAARHNREHFLEAGVLALNLMGSPGAGKTAVLEATARAAAAKGWKLGAVSADLATDNDARRLQKAGIPSKAITTGQAATSTPSSSTARSTTSPGRPPTCSSSRTSATSSAPPSTTSARRPTWWCSPSPRARTSPSSTR